MKHSFCIFYLLSLFFFDCTLVTAISALFSPLFFPLFLSSSSLSLSLSARCLLRWGFRHWVKPDGRCRIRQWLKPKTVSSCFPARALLILAHFLIWDFFYPPQIKELFPTFPPCSDFESLVIVCTPPTSLSYWGSIVLLCRTEHCRSANFMLHENVLFLQQTFKRKKKPNQLKRNHSLMKWVVKQINQWWKMEIRTLCTQ